MRRLSSTGVEGLSACSWTRSSMYEAHRTTARSWRRHDRHASKHSEAPSAVERNDWSRAESKGMIGARQIQKRSGRDSADLELRAVRRGRRVRHFAPAQVVVQEEPPVRHQAAERGVPRAQLQARPARDRRPGCQRRASRHPRAEVGRELSPRRGGACYSGRANERRARAHSSTSTRLGVSPPVVM